MKKMILIGLALGLSGCLSSSHLVPEEDPHALIKLSKGYEKGVGVAQGKYQDFYILEDKSCNKGTLLMHFDYMSGTDAERRIPSEKLTTILATTTKITGNSKAKCQHMLSFMPETGKAYLLTHTANNSGCKLDIVDGVTGEAPDSIIKEELIIEEDAKDKIMCPRFF